MLSVQTKGWLVQWLRWMHESGKEALIQRKNLLWISWRTASPFQDAPLKQISFREIQIDQTVTRKKANQRSLWINGWIPAVKHWHNLSTEFGRTVLIPSQLKHLVQMSLDLEQVTNRWSMVSVWRPQSTQEDSCRSGRQFLLQSSALVGRLLRSSLQPWILTLGGLILLQRRLQIFLSRIWFDGWRRT